MKTRQSFTRYNTILLYLLLLLSGCQTTEQEGTQEFQASPTADSDLEEQDNSRLAEREEMVEIQIGLRDISDTEVIEAMLAVPRHKFVPQEYEDLAYRDHPLPIGYGQTISQPYIVALMTDALDLEKSDRVLEIGTGSGYQAAILAELVTQVFTIEIIPELAQEAQARLDRLGYSNIDTLQADGYYGWEDQAPFDAVIVTAAPDHLPQPLIQQLADNGRMIIPIGPVGAVQTLWLFEFSGGELNAINLGAVKFVPLTGER